MIKSWLFCLPDFSISSWRVSNQLFIFMKSWPSCSERKIFILPMMLNIALFVTFEVLYRYQINVGPYPTPSFYQWCLLFLIAFHDLSVMDVRWNKYIISERMKYCMFASFTIVKIYWLAVSTICFVIKPGQSYTEIWTPGFISIIATLFDQPYFAPWSLPAWICFVMMSWIPS